MKYNTEGAEMPSHDFTIPDGEYKLFVEDVKEGKSKAGDYQVICDLKVSDGDHKNFPIKFHRVTFQDPKKNAKAAGMSMFFLKVLGQPHKGEIEIHPDQWIGSQFRAYLEAQEYNGFKSMKVKWFAPLEEQSAESQLGPAGEIEEVPF